MIKELVIVMGYNAAGKSTYVEQFTLRGYHRLNRDLEGGSLDDLATKADHLLKGGVNTIVLDNTYATVKSRESIVKVAKANGVPIRVLWLTTSFEDAQLNACLRMVQRTGKLLQPEDFKKLNDPNLFPPVALFHYRKEFQKPTTKEGFDKVQEVPFQRQWPAEYKNKAIIVDYDGTLRLSTGQQKFPIELSDIKMLPNRAEVLKAWQKKGYLLLGASNQSGIAKGVPEAKIVACFEETNKNLGLTIHYLYCKHRIPPVSCYCRKPHPGMGAFFIETYKLNPAECIMVGDMTTDETFAERCGFQYQHESKFFK
jgi:HAD superfamily hydrolase (TIGR01662 family)